MHDPLNDAVALTSIAHPANGAHAAQHDNVAQHTNGAQHNVAPERTWSMQAAADRDQAIALIQDARQRVCDLRMLLNHYDTSLSFKLDSFQRELNDRLGGLLVAREDAR